MPHCQLTITVLLLSLAITVRAQDPYFRKLTVVEGLNDGSVPIVSQDSEGYIWIASQGALNRYDGTTVKTYSYKTGDPYSIPASIVESMGADSSGHFFIGFETGLVSFERSTGRFHPVKSLEGVIVSKIIPINKKEVYLASRRGLVQFIPNTNAVHFFRDNADSLLRLPVMDMVKHQDKLYLATRKGLLCFDPHLKSVNLIAIPSLEGQGLLNVSVDDNGWFWAVTGRQRKVWRISPDFLSSQSFDSVFSVGVNTIINISGLEKDRAGNIWISTQLDGLLRFDTRREKWSAYKHDPLQPFSISTNLHSSVFCDRDGMVWVGGNKGVNYFDPQENFFTIIPPFLTDIDILNRRVARVTTEDQQGNLWFGTIDGVVRFDPRTKKYTEWNNRDQRAPVIHYNSIRGLYTDPENNIWIATGRGINRFNSRKGSMEFLRNKDGIPEHFYFSVDTDREGRIWFSSRDGDGFYYYDTASKKFSSIREYPSPLKAFAGKGGRKVFHDSRGRYWLGFNGEGLGVYDPSNNTTRIFTAGNKAGSIAGNIIVDIREDKNGTIWVSSYSGVSGINPVNWSITNFNSTNGLASNTTGPLAVDSLNRLWIGTRKGLQLLDSSRKYFTLFTQQDGLPSMEFPEHFSYTTRSGNFIMPTQNGYISFDPLQYCQQNRDMAFYAGSFSLFGKELSVDLNRDDALIELAPDENFFSIEMNAINFRDPSRTWYAYKLEGVDDDWNYTQHNIASYTKIPGGSYRFSYMASNSADHWQQQPRSFTIKIGRVFYNTPIFWIVLISLGFLGLYLIYRYRIRQQALVFELEKKAQLLEKEKTKVMFESLKQQLNPHFLFNSLTSLSGLIETDQKLAGSFLARMSKLYRYILKNDDKELVALREELDFVKVYADLQNTRFRNGLVIKIDVPDEMMDRKIAPVTLQNLVENAIKHNIIDEGSPLVIELYVENEYLVVKNNLQKKNVVETSNQHGMKSLGSLYQFLSARPIITEESTTAYKVSIPLIT
ncbi:histidine kinase [Flavihumibacter sediminis]|nr:histidine kinase [Flavihumibacter sediminis]